MAVEPSACAFVLYDLLEAYFSYERDVVQAHQQVSGWQSVTTPVSVVASSELASKMEDCSSNSPSAVPIGCIATGFFFF